MAQHSLSRVIIAVAALTLMSGASVARDKLPLQLVSSSAAFDRQCEAYYRADNDEDVAAGIAGQFCTCIAGNIESQGLGADVLDFLGRTYSEDLTAFIDEYPNGNAWMDAFFAADEQCKNADYGDNQPPGEEPNPPPGPIEAASWGGVVRAGPGQNHARLGSLENGERVMLLENTSIITNGYPWWLIEFWGSREGYMWGGLLCSLDAPMEGIHETCR